jgi:hypothetical protein
VSVTLITDLAQNLPSFDFCGVDQLLFVFMAKDRHVLRWRGAEGHSSVPNFTA